MKINIWKLFLIVVFVPAIVACTDYRDNNMVDDSISFVDSNGNWTENKGYVSISVYDGKYEIPIVKNGKGLAGTTVRIEASETALAAYNEANATNYVVLPSECYKIETEQLDFSKGDIRKYATISWDMDAIFDLDTKINYVVPIQLFSTAGNVPVSEDRGLMLLHFEISKVSMKPS